MNTKQKDMDFTEEEIQEIRESDPARDGQLAKQMGTTRGSIKALRRYLGTKKASAKVAVSVDGRKVVKTVTLPDIKKKLLVTCNGSSILLDKDDVGGLTIEGNNITIHGY